MIERLSPDEIKQLLAKYPEQPKFDWKESLDLSNEETKSHFVKDIVAFGNSHGEETGYILYGVNPDRENPILGLSKTFDDANLQELVKSKLDKHINFLYHETLVDNARVGVAIIPRSFSRPHIIRADFGVLKAGQIPIRKGSSNQLATAEDLALMFYDPKRVEAIEFEKTVVRQMIIEGKYPLSSIALKTLDLARRIGDDEMVQWLTKELNGYEQGAEENYPSYRVVQCFASPYEIEYIGWLTPQQIFAQYKDRFVELKLGLPFSLSKIEGNLSSRDVDKGFFVASGKSGHFSPESTTLIWKFSCMCFLRSFKKFCSKLSSGYLNSSSLKMRPCLSKSYRLK